MTVVRPNSIAGINSITVQTGQALNIHDASGNLIRNITSSSGISTFQSVEVTSGDLTVGVSTLFVDKSAGNIGIGTAVPGHALDISDDGVAFPSAAGSTLLRVRDAGGSATISIDSAANANSVIQFGDTAAASVGTIQYSHVTNHLQFNTNGDGEKMRISSSGHVGITSASPTATRFSGSVSGLLNLAGTKPCIYISETDSKDSGGVNKALYLGLSGGSVYCGSNADFTFATGDTTTTQRLKIDTSGNVDIFTGNLGIHTTDANTEHIAGAASSFIGLYMNDGFIGFPTHLNRDGGYFIATHVNALNAGPVSLGSSMTLHGTWTIV